MDTGKIQKNNLGQGGNILIVDDDRDFAKSLGNILVKEGYRIEIAYSGKAAEEVLSHFSPEVALIDIRLGKSSGVELIAKLKQLQPDLSCVMISAYASVDTARQALKQGAYDYLCKPVDADDLLATLDRCCEWVVLKRKKTVADEALRISEDKFSMAFRNSPEGVVISTLSNGRIIDISENIERITGYRRDDMIGQPVLEFGIWRDPKVRTDMVKVLQKQGVIQNVCVEMCTRADEIRQCELSAEVINIGDEPCMITNIRDVTERIQMAETLSKSHRALTVLNQCNHALVHASTEQKLLDEVCTIIAKASDYCLTGVAYIEHDERKTMRVMVSAGRGIGYLQSVKVTWGQDELGCGPWGTTVKTGHRYVANDLLNDPRFSPWREAAIKYDLASIVVLPLKKHVGEVFGILAIYAPEPYAFDSDEVKLLEDLANNLSYGIISLRAEIERKQAEQALRKSEEQFRTLVSNLPCAVYRYVVEAGQWRLAVISDEIGTISGYPASEFLTDSGRSLASITHLDDVNLVTGELSASITEHRPYEIEYRILRTSGEERWVFEKGQPVYEDGHCGYLDGTIFDVTARKRAEEEVRKSRDELELRVQERTAALSESEERFRSVSQSANDAMISMDGFGKTIFWNQAATRMFDRSEAEVKGKTLAPLIIPGRFQEAHAAGLKRLREGGEQHIIGKLVELVGLRADGTEFPIEISLSTWKSEKEVFFNAIVRDITDRKEVEAQLKKTKEQAETASAMVETTLQNMGQGILMVDGQGNILVYNNQLLAYVGVTREEADACRTFEEYFQLGKKNFSEESTRQALHHARLGGTATYEMISISGMIIEVRQNPLTDGGFVRTYTDITALKAAEENFRSLLESAPDAIVIVNSNGKIQLVNKQTVKLFEWDKDELIGKVVEDLVPELFRTHHPELMDRYFKDPSVRPMEVSGELYGVTKNGREFPVEITLSPIETNEGIVVAAGLHDVTAHKQAEETLRIAKQMADEANQAKSTFLANMSHELRTPLNAIIGYSEMLWEESKDKEEKTFSDDLQRIRMAGKQLMGLINNILDLSKIEANKMELESIPLSLVDIVEGSAQTIATTATRKGLRLITYVDPELPQFVMGDPIRVGQILINLVANAIKFTDKGEIVIRAELVGDGDSDKVTIRFSVIDHGIGISEEDQKKLFQPFAQVESSISRKFGGTGLGLSICQRLTKMMGGKIKVNSQLGKGTEFHITLSLNKSDKVLEHGKVSDLKGLRVLLIVRNATEQHIYQRYLEYWRADVTLSDELSTCYEQCMVAKREGKPYDIVLIGPQWSREERFELCDLVTKQPTLSDTRFVSLLTGRRTPRVPDSSHYVCLDVDPVRRAELLTVIARTVGRESPEMMHYEEALEKLETGKTPTVAQALELGTLILVAEDNPVNRDVIRSQLNLLGYACEMAEDGKEAWDAWCLKKYAILLVDCHMPNMDGFELTEVIRKDEKETETHTPIIAITADAQQEEVKHCLDAGMDDYLSKPFNMTKLRQILRKWMPPAQSTKAEAAATITIAEKPVPEAGAGSDNVPIDERVLKDMFGDNPEIFKEILNDFVDSTQKIIEEIKTGLQQNLAEAVKQAAHKLKSAARSIGANELTDICLSLETACKEDDWKTINNQAPSLDKLMSEIEIYVSRL